VVRRLYEALLNWLVDWEVYLALRDVGLLIGALALARLATAYEGSERAGDQAVSSPA
jgi:hypothetical protein